MNKVRYAVVGCGDIAHSYHLPALTSLAAAEFAVACDVVEERAKETAAKFRAADYCTDYRQVIARNDIDLVCIFSKIDSHTEIAVAAAEAGKHVFVQKPFAKTIAAGQRMVEVAAAHGVEVTPSFMHRYFDESMAAAELTRAGRIGRIEFIRIRNGTCNPRHTVPSYGGALMDIGAHGVDLLRSLTGQEIAAVSARVEGDEPAPPDGSDLLGSEVNAWMHYRLSGGAIVSHEVQWSQRAGTVRFEAQIYGTEGTIFLRAPRTGAELEIASLDGDKMEWETPTLPGRPDGEAHHDALIQSIASNNWTAQTGADGIAVLKVCEAARRAADSGCWVEIG